MIKGGHELREKQELPRESDEILFDLYRSYGSFISQDLWPLENARWYELVFCLAINVAGQDLPHEGIRDMVRLLSRMNLISIDTLRNLLRDEESSIDSSPILITVRTLLQRSGFTYEEARKAVICFYEVAQEFLSRYEGKVQLLFRKYGKMMMEELTRDFALSELNKEETSRAFASWLQNTLNMPLPASTPIAEAACEKLGTRYSTLVEAADRSDINVGILDDMLYAYWEDMLEEARGRETEEDVGQ